MAALPVVLPGLALHGLLLQLAGYHSADHRVGGGKEEGEHVWL
jgi:hypothetical protein